MYLLVFLDILWISPTRDSSHHQNYIFCTFRIGNPNLNLYLWLASWLGAPSQSNFKTQHGVFKTCRNHLSSNGLERRTPTKVEWRFDSNGSQFLRRSGLVLHATPGLWPCGFWHTAREPKRVVGVSYFPKERQGKTRHFPPEMGVKWLKCWNFQEDLQSKQALGLMMMMMMMMMIDSIYFPRGLIKHNSWRVIFMWDEKGATFTENSHQIPDRNGRFMAHLWTSPLISHISTRTGGGFNFFLFSPRNLGKLPIWLIFSNWIETTNEDMIPFFRLRNFNPIVDERNPAAIDTVGTLSTLFTGFLYIQGGTVLFSIKSTQDVAGHQPISVGWLIAVWVKAPAFVSGCDTDPGPRAYLAAVDAVEVRWIFLIKKKHRISLGEGKPHSDFYRKWLEHFSEIWYWYTPPPEVEQFAPEKWWLEDKPLLLGPGNFSRASWGSLDGVSWLEGCFGRTPAHFSLVFHMVSRGWQLGLEIETKLDDWFGSIHVHLEQLCYFWTIIWVYSDTMYWCLMMHIWYRTNHVCTIFMCTHTRPTEEIIGVYFPRFMLCKWYLLYCILYITVPWCTGICIYIYIYIYTEHIHTYKYIYIYLFTFLDICTWLYLCT